MNFKQEQLYTYKALFPVRRAQTTSDRAGCTRWVSMQLVFCTKCETLKPVEAFSKDKRKKNRFKCQCHCKECATKSASVWRRNNTDRYRKNQKRFEEKNPQRHLKCKIGITLEEKQRKFNDQGKVCGACGSATHNHPNLLGESGWCADHNHITGNFRGVLCWPCNVTLGHAAESIKRLSGLITYLGQENAAINTLKAAVGMTVERAA